MPQGLPRKIRIAFILQVVMVSLAVHRCGWLGASAVIKQVLVQRRVAGRRPTISGAQRARRSGVPRCRTAATSTS